MKKYSVLPGLIALSSFSFYVAQSPQKNGAWEHLKIVNNSPSLSKDFGTAYPIGCCSIRGVATIDNNRIIVLYNP